MKKSVKKLLVSFCLGLIFQAVTQTTIAQNSSENSTTNREIFPRNQGYEQKVLQALGGWVQRMSPDVAQSLGTLCLQAVEIQYSVNSSITGDEIISEFSDPQAESLRAQVNGILASLVMTEVGERSTDPSVHALKQWATELFHSMKVRSAKAILNEFQKWENDPCGYQAAGYKAPPDCGLKSLNQLSLYAGVNPPADLITKAGFKSVLGDDVDKVTEVVAIGAYAITAGASAVALSSSLGAIVYSYVAAGVTTTATTSLFGAFGGSMVATASSTTTASAASGIIGSTGWASVVAAPVAAVIMAVVVGTIEGFRVVENEKIKPMIKMKLQAAIEDPINIANVIADPNSKTMFFMAFMESSIKGFQIPDATVAGEVRFYCQAGYVSRFKLTYTIDVDKTGYFPDLQKQEFTTSELTVGNQESFDIPANAKDIKVEGSYAAGINDWKELFNESIPTPTYACYTSYGTVFEAKYKNDCPEVGKMVTKANELTVTQGGGYAAWVNLTYEQDGKTIVLQDQQGLDLGWRKVYDIPADAVNIRLLIQEATGWVGEPWKTVVDKSWPESPNECIKVYGTTLDPKWNNECD